MKNIATLIILLILVLHGFAADDSVTPSASGSSSSSASASASSTMSSSVTATGSVSASSSGSASMTSSVSTSPSASSSISPSVSPSVSPSETISVSLTSSSSPSPTASTSSSPSGSTSFSSTTSSSFSSTMSISESFSPSMTSSQTSTSSSSSSASMTSTQSVSGSSTATATNSKSSISTSTATATTSKSSISTSTNIALDVLGQLTPSLIESPRVQVSFLLRRSGETFKTENILGSFSLIISAVETALTHLSKTSVEITTVKDLTDPIHPKVLFPSTPVNKIRLLDDVLLSPIYCILVDMIVTTKSFEDAVQIGIMWKTSPQSILDRISLELSHSNEFKDITIESKISESVFATSTSIKSSEDSKSLSSLSPGAVAGIIAGSIAVIVAAAVRAMKKQKGSKNREETSITRATTTTLPSIHETSSRHKKTLSIEESGGTRANISNIQSILSADTSSSTSKKNIDLLEQFATALQTRASSLSTKK
jgi:hypothetical protein